MPSSRDFPSTIKVTGRRGSSRGRTESPVYDARSSSKGTARSSRSKSKSSKQHHQQHSSSSRRSTRERSKSRDRSSYEPPERHEMDDATSSAMRRLDDDADDNDDNDDDDDDEDGHDNYHGYESRDEDRRDDDRRRGGGRRSTSRDRRRKYSSHASGGETRRRERERERDRSDRKRREARARREREYDDADHYRQMDEADDEVVDEGDDYQYANRMSNMNTDNAAAANTGQKQGCEDTDPFGLNLCQGSESFSDVEAPPSGTRRSRRFNKLANTSMSTNGMDATTWSDDDRIYRPTPRQDHSYASIAVTAIQLLVLMLQLAMCGVAPLDVNPMVGPFPDAFSEWGGKNAYLILENQEYWRFITPAFLHVGVLHLLANAFCLLYSSALFEREWGSWTWLFIFLVSEAGCVGVSSVTDPDTIAVGSSGALMGLFAAKLAHVLTYTFFDTKDMSQDEGIHVDQLGSVLCGLTLVSLLSAFTYVDWSGHMGGLSTGFFAGMLVFARPIKGCCYSLLWGFLGLTGLAATAALVAYLLINETEPYEELADACEYFRHLFPEGYECGCLW